MPVGHDFELIKARDIPELHSRAELYRHRKTGAEVLSISNSDENKVFGITFRTPPADETGVAHILEHSVLCGSRKYPVKEPFVELLKGSLQTFLNAFTYPDKTCYPVASQNLQDFYNLIDVYLDAVFYPLLTPYTLAQEGWHYELEDSGQALQYKGVVFSEMKGAYSSADRVLLEYSQQSLFPNNSYGLDSGGNPRHIPELTFADFVNFHRKYYHPSNSRIFFYGDDDPLKRLALVNEYLDDFEAARIDSAVAPQPRFDQPRRIRRPFAVSPDEKSRPKGMVTVNWLLTEPTDVEMALSFRILNHALLGMPASPLRKALIDSGLGEDLAGIGLEDELRQMYFSTGLKGIAVDDAERVEELILETLSDLAEDGFDPLTVEAAFNTIEFRLRENNPGHYPRGLVLMLRALTTWLYDGDPLAALAFEQPLARLKRKNESVRGYLEELLQQYFLENLHRTTVILEPDPELHVREATEERQRLSSIQASMTPEQIREIKETADKLRQLQQTPDPPEALAAIPRLKLSDLDRHNKIIPLSVFQENGARILYHDLETNGILYVDVGFDLHSLPQEYLPYVPLFGRALLEIGTDREDFVILSQRISSKTGGIHPESLTTAVKGAPTCAAWLFLRGKAVQSRCGDLLSILQDVLLTVKLDNRERFRQMVLEEKARREQRLVPEGHRFVNLRLQAHFAEAGWAAEQIKGVSYLFFLRRLASQVDEDWPTVLSTMEQMRQCLVNREGLLVNVTIDGAAWKEVEPQLAEFIRSLPAAKMQAMQWSPDDLPQYEGLTLPAQVNYVGKGANIYQLGYRLHGSAQVISRYLRTAYLWEHIRVQGGAYGAFCLFNHLSGGLSFISYRDPHIEQTLQVYDRVGHFLRTTDLHDDELTKSIIGAIGDMDVHLLPDAKGYTSMVRYLAGDTDADRQQRRQEVLATTIADFRSFADVLDEVKEKGLVKVLGPAEQIETAAISKRDSLQVVKVL
ncbi:MAG: insulinase family protein [Deltaproteobacteria bacterium]|nr:insulinase family protein [Deltaproteobacteria bacterium]